MESTWAALEITDANMYGDRNQNIVVASGLGVGIQKGYKGIF